VATVTNFIAHKNGNIVYLDQHVDREQDIFFMRVEIEFSDTNFTFSSFKNDFQDEIASKYNMQCTLHKSETKPKTAIFVSKYDHCLYDLLGRYNSNEMNLEIAFILSNHEDLKHIAEKFKIPFYHVPVTKESKSIAEDRPIELLEEHQVDFIVLARYMQIVSKKLIDRYPSGIINIHHSFLPAFIGAKPYHSAFRRGVKIIGATSHYITEELDAGPIIEQDVAHVSHTHSISDLIMKGRDLEKIVLSNAVKLHVNRKVLVYNNKTVIFS
jgi:formyltetrahydrofolate deformylase